MAALARPRPLFPTRFYLLHPWSRVLRGTCTSWQLLRQLLLRCSNFQHPCRSPALLSVAAPGATLPPPSLESYLPTSDRQEWWKCKGIVGRSRASCARGISASDLQERRKCRRIVGNNPCHARQNDPCPALTSNSQLPCLRPFGLFHFCATPRTNGPA
jgi:hypothetical protein